jgi:AmiR/NasT family two-component response regulator
LIETPFSDLRLRIVDFLERESARRAGSTDDLKTLWTAVLLGVHRGGRQKAKAVRQIGQAIVTDPGRTESLLPVLAVAVRSVRPPEARAGLAALMTALEARPELAEPIRRFLPELQWTEVPA